MDVTRPSLQLNLYQTTHVFGFFKQCGVWVSDCLMLIYDAYYFIDREINIEFQTTDNINT